MALVWLWADTPSYTLTCTLCRTPRRHRDSPPRVGPRIRGRSPSELARRIAFRTWRSRISSARASRAPVTRHLHACCIEHASPPGRASTARAVRRRRVTPPIRHAHTRGPHRSMVAQSFGPSLVGSLGVVLARKALEHGLHSGYCCPQRCGDARQAVAECRKGERGGLSCGQRRRAEPVARGGGGKTSN